MRVPHALYVEAGAEGLSELLQALSAAGLRFGWLEWREPDPVSESLREAAERGALRAVAVGDGLSVAVKPRKGPPVVRDLVREHFLGCAVVFVSGGPEAGVAAVRAAAAGSWEVIGADGRVLRRSTDELVARLRSPLPLG